jgi:hypothetical protein
MAQPGMTSFIKLVTSNSWPLGSFVPSSIIRLSATAVKSLVFDAMAKYVCLVSSTSCVRTKAAQNGSLG